MQRAQLMQTIQGVLGAYVQVLSQVQNDPAQTAFYQNIDVAVNSYNEMSNMIH
jgi:hypothetical protein